MYTVVVIPDKFFFSFFQHRLYGKSSHLYGLVKYKEICNRDYSSQKKRLGLLGAFYLFPFFSQKKNPFSPV